MNTNITEAADRILDDIKVGQATRLSLMIIIAEAIQTEQGIPVTEEGRDLLADTLKEAIIQQAIDIAQLRRDNKAYDAGYQFLRRILLTKGRVSAGLVSVEDIKVGHATLRGLMIKVAVAIQTEHRTLRPFTWIEVR